jgi:dTDP-4-dehydrorhamnose 3,5-epimerase
MSDFIDGAIDGVIIRDLIKFNDDRGWLAELFRIDELPTEFQPQMTYLSITLPGIARGPHEHVDQADYFCFIGPSNFKVYLWDNRAESPTYHHYHTLIAGIDKPTAVIVPKGVVHAYKNIGTEPGTVINCPNRLYKGTGRREPIDEIRHESETDSIYKLD